MQVILLETIARLGEMGAEVTVKPGFARNFLLPQGKALPATKENRAAFEAQKTALAKEMDARKAEAEKLSTELQKIQAVGLDRQASETGQLYGSIKARDIETALAQKGVSIPRSQILIGEPIKMLGDYEVKVALHPEIMLTLPVQVNRLSA